MQNAGVLRQPLIAVADSLSFRADLNERGAKVRRFAPTCVPTQQGQSMTAICAFDTFERRLESTLSGHCRRGPRTLAFGGSSRYSPLRKGAFVAPVVDVCEGKQAAPA